MTADELTDAEREQLKALATLQKVAWIAVRRWLGLVVAVFLLLAGAFSVYLVWRAAHSVSRFDATTRLLYTPRTIAKIEGPSDRQVMSVIDRRTLKRRVGDRLPMSERERMCLSSDLQIRQERKPTNLFTLTAASETWKGAVKKVNLYAEILVQAYVDYRKRDLENLSESLARRQRDLVGKLAEIDGDVRAFVSQTGESAPVEALQVLNAALVEQRREVSALNVQIANEEMKKRKLEQAAGGNGAAVAAVAPQIRQRTEAIAQLDADLAKLREVYTDLNPKVVGKMGEREALRKELARFLADKGVSDVNVDGIDAIEKAAAEQVEAVSRLAVLGERRASVQGELAENEKRVEALNAIVPRFERLKARRGEIEASLRELEDKVDDIAYLTRALPNDLQQIERAGGAGDKGPLGVRPFLFAFLGAGFATATLVLWLLVYELVWGRVRCGDEIRAYDTLTFLGSVPGGGRDLDAEMAEAMGVVALRLCSDEVPRGVLLVCDLPGAERNPAFVSQVGWSASMSGLRVFRLTIVLGRGFEPPADATPMVGVHRKDAEGWFPAANRFALAPTERQMLAADLSALRTEFDRVFVCVAGGVRKGGTFLAQLLELSDAALLVLGAGRTTRAWFAFARAAVEKAGKPAQALLTGVSEKALRSELEVSR